MTGTGNMSGMSAGMAGSMGIAHAQQSQRIPMGSDYGLNLVSMNLRMVSFDLLNLLCDKVILFSIFHFIKNLRFLFVFHFYFLESFLKYLICC